MNLLSVENISKSYGERLLFSGLSFGINKDQKIALIAKNGTGKTSILNILAGKDTADEGLVSFRNGLRLSLLEQEPDLDNSLTVEETVFSSGNEILKVIEAYNQALSDPEDQDRYQKAFEAMEHHNAWDFETHYKQVLFRLQLEDMNAIVGNLSGGQKKRLALANALINKPDLLILDEPTNHLDLEMIEWLEAYFAKEKLSLLMVTHDRYFLERVCNEIIELDQGTLSTFKGNYSYYLEKKDAMLEQAAVEQHKAKILYKKELEWMRRQPKARTTKSKSRIGDFQEVSKKALQVRAQEELQLELNMERLGSKTVELHNVGKAFPGKPILENFDYTFKRGERVGVIGKNGTGKTTFLNIITGAVKPDRGKVVTGDTVSFGYYTQQGIRIKEGQKVIEVIREYGDYIPLKKGRQISAQQLLERFLFDRKKQYDFVEKLSGGERKRLFLCTVLIQNPNFLILDEPTNDLDVVTLNVLEDFLMDFPGCLLVVSHDRYLMDKIVDHLFVFRGNGKVEDFPGSYSDFRAAEEEKSAERKKQPGSTQQKSDKSVWRDQESGGKLSYSEQKEYQTLEAEIEKLENEKEVLQSRFADKTLSGEAIDALSIDLNKVLDKLAEKTERWFTLSERIGS
jgi:ATP-binding cassette subfamily F protein uup